MSEFDEVYKDYKKRKAANTSSRTFETEYQMYQDRKKIKAAVSTKDNTNSYKNANLVKQGFEIGFNQPEQQVIKKPTTSKEEFNKFDAYTPTAPKKPTTSKEEFNKFDAYNPEESNTGMQKVINDLEKTPIFKNMSKEKQEEALKQVQKNWINQTKIGTSEGVKSTTIPLDAEKWYDKPGNFVKGAAKGALKGATDLAGAAYDNMFSPIGQYENILNANLNHGTEKQKADILKQMDEAGYEVTYDQSGKAHLQNKITKGIDKASSTLTTSPYAPTSEKAGNVVGSIAEQIGQMGMIGQGTSKIGANIGNTILKNATQSAALGATNAGLNAAKEDLSTKDTAKEMARGGLFFGAGSLGSQATGKAIESALIAKGMQNSTKNYVLEQMAKGAAFSLAGEAATYPTYGLMGDQAPSIEQIGTTMLTGMIFDTVSGLVAIPSLKANSKSVLDQSSKQLVKGLEILDHVKKSNVDQKTKNIVYENILLEINRTRGELNNTRLLGEQTRVNEYNQILDFVENDLKKQLASQYIYKQQAELGNVQNNLIGKAPTGVAGVSAGKENLTLENSRPYYGDAVGKPYTNLPNRVINQTGNKVKGIGQASQLNQVKPNDTKPIDSIPQKENLTETKIEQNNDTPLKNMVYFGGKVQELGNKALNDKINELNPQEKTVYKVKIGDKAQYVNVIPSPEQGVRAVSILHGDSTKPYEKLETIDLTAKQEVSPSKPKSIAEWREKAVANVDYETVRRALTWSSFNPEGRAKRDIESLNRVIQDVAGKLEQKYSENMNEQQEALLIDELENFKTGLEKRFNAMVSAESRVASPAVTGPAKFNYAKNEKALNAHHNKQGEYIDYYKNAEKIISKKLDRLKGEEELTNDALKEVRKDTEFSLRTILEAKTGKTHTDATLIKQNLQSRTGTRAGKGEVEAVQEIFNMIKTFEKESKVTVFTNRSSFWNLLDRAKEVKNKKEVAAAKTKEALQNDSVPEHTTKLEKHTKTGADLYVVRFNERFTPEQFKEMKEVMKSYGGSYSSFKKGFIFDSEPDFDMKQVEAPKAEVEVKNNANYGKEAVAYTNDNQEIKTRYKLVDASELITSHDTNLDINQSYPQELQPRNRDRAASKLQIEKILGELNPYRLGESNNVSDGAPIVGSDGIVESGNGRIIALTKGYTAGHENIEAYKRWLINHAGDYGIDTSNMPKNPILVRERMTDTDRVSFTKKANENTIAQLSPSEVAKSDATKLTAKTLNHLIVGDNTTNINSLENKGFINNFIAECVPENERAAITTSDGLLNKQGVERVQNAIFEKVYESRQLIEMMAESTDINIKNVINTMIGVSPKIAKVKENIKAGATHNLDIAHSIAKAASKLSQLKAKGETVEEYLQQIGMFSDLTDVGKNLLAIIDSNMRSGKKLTQFFNTYYDMLEKLGDPRNESLVPIAVPDRNTLLVAAKESMKDAENITIWDIQREVSEGNSKEVQRTKGKQFNPGEEQGYSSTQTGPQLSRGDGSNTDVKHTKKPSQIYREFGEKLGFDIANRPQKRTLGTFNTRTSLVKIKKANDLSVLSHETGHFLDKEYQFTNKKANYAKELYPLGINTSPATASKEYILSEGVAEYVRLYLTNPDYASQVAPLFSDVFEKSLSKGELKALKELQEDITKFTDLVPQEKIKKAMSFGGDKSHKEHLTVGELAEYTYAALFDRSHTLIYGAKKMGGDKAADRIKNALGASRGYAGKAEYSLMEAQTDAYGKDIGESLQSILKPIIEADSYKDFSAYLVAKRGLDYYERGLEFPTTKEDCLDTITYYDEMKPDFKESAQKILIYNQNVLKQLVDIGMISEGTYNKIIEENPHYVPCNRVLNESMTRFSKTNDSNPIKKLKGGGQDIIDPIEGIVNSTFVYKKLVGDYLVKKEFFKIADTESDIGALVIKQTTKYRPNTINLQVFRKEIEKLMEGLDIDDKAFNELDLDISKVLFETDTIARENEIAFKENDKITLYKVDPLIYYAYKQSSINNQALNKAIDWMAKLNSIKRKFIITTPRYMVWNFSRDTIGNLTNTRAGITPIDVAKGLKDAMAQNEVYQLAQKAGAFTSFYSSERDFAQDVIKQLNVTHGQAKTVNQYLGKAFKTTKDITSRYGFKPSEMAGRLAEFEKSLVKAYQKEHGKGKSHTAIINEITADPKTYRVMLDEATRNARDITIDFNQSGGLVKDIQLNRISLFSNAGLLGANKTVRVFTDKTTRGRAIVRTAIVATIAMALHIFNSRNKNYEELPDYKKDYYFNIPLGDPLTTDTFLTLPLDYGTSFFALATPRRAYDLMKGDEKAFKGYEEDVKQSFNLDMMLPDLLELYIELQSNKNWTGANILNYADQNKPAYLQYGDSTSGTSKAVGHMLKDIPVNLGPLQSPKQLDHVLQNQFGTIGKIALTSIDQAAGTKEGTPIVGLVTNGFTYETYGANTQNTFYEYKSNLDKFVNEEKETGHTKFDNAEKTRTKFNKVANDITDLKKKMDKQGLSEAEKSKLQDKALEKMKECIELYEDND